MSRPTTYPALSVSSSKSSQHRSYVERIPAPPYPLASDQKRFDVIDQLLPLSNRYQNMDWDGEGAEPIPAAAFQEARRFLLTLHPATPLPEVVPEPDGYLGLEWYANTRLLYVVSFNGTGVMSCSGLMGRERILGTRYTDEGIPIEVLRNIARVLQ